MTRKSPVIFIVLFILALIVYSSAVPYQAARAAGPTPVFINEIHYDNASTDAGEAVEIAGPAGTDLAGWNLVLYNGNGGVVYDTLSLSGIIPDQDAGYGTLAFTYPVNGIQNGAPDGIVLFDGVSVIQFLSYEGTMTAADGPAAGMTSQDIGVLEDSSTPLGFSLQLTGTGTAYEDFSWASPQANTFGAPNTGQSFGEAPDVAPVVTHTDPADGAINQALDSTLEVTFSEAVDLGAGWFELLCTSSGLHDATVSGGPVTFLLDPLVDFSYSESCTLTIFAAGVTDQDAEDPPNAMEADHVIGFGITAGTPVNTDLVINEIDYDQPGTDAAEFIEIKNTGVSDTDLSGWTLQLVNGSNNSIYQTYTLSGILAAGDYFVVCANAATVPNCDLDVSPDTNLVQNGSPDAVALSYDGILVDAVSYEGNTAAPYTEGSGVGLEDDSSVEAAGISRYPDGIDTDSNNVDLSLRCISPGEANLAATSGCVVNTNLVINEVDYDQPGTDTAEFIEIKNTGDRPTDLSGWTLQLVNGSNDSPYQTFTLSGTLAAGDYFVVCANAATVPNCDLDVTPDTNLIQNGSPDAVALWYGDTLIDTVSYEGDTGAPFTEGSGAGLYDSSSGSISRCPDGFDSNQNNLDFVYSDTITPGAANYCVAPEACGDEFTPIYTIQGSGPASLLDGQEVATEGVVVGDYQYGGKSGYFIQDPAGDSDPATSDGIFVYSSSPDVAVGDQVRVRGYVDEYYDLTEITSVAQVWICGSGSVIPMPLTLPLTAVADLEAYEGMLVTFPQPLYIAEYYNYDRYGEIVLATSRQFTPTALYAPDSPEAAQALADNLLNRIKLDDGRSWENPDPALHPNGAIFNLDNLFRGGDILNNLTGVMDFNFGEYKIQPVSAGYVAANPRPLQPEYVGDGIKLASFNVLNYFTTLGSRGADTALEFTRQRDKIFAALAGLDADVVGLIEIENNTAAIQDLVDGLNAVVGAGTYAYVDTGVIGPDEIKVAFIYKPATVSLAGDYAVLDTPEFLDPNNTGEARNRPALAQSFMDNQTGGIFTAVVNHLKSKSSACGAGDDHPLAGSCNLTRTLAAQILVDWLATDPTGSGDQDFILIGDLNSYDKEDPITVLKDGGYAELVFDYLGEFAYSYVFDGQLGYLDHALALANADLAEEIAGVTVWHINADEPDLIDYDMTFKKDAQDALYAVDPFRSSDHDPVLIGLDVCDEIAPTLEISLTPDQLWPANHKMVDVTAQVTAADNFDPAPTVILVSVVSSEEDDDGGDGSTENDIVILDDFTFQLRAERTATDQLGRIYTITYKVVDACGNETYGTAEVLVPFNQNDKK